MVFPASAICGAVPISKYPDIFCLLRAVSSPAFILASLSPRPLICGPFPHDELFLPPGPNRSSDVPDGLITCDGDSTSLARSQNAEVEGPLSDSQAVSQGEQRSGIREGL